MKTKTIRVFALLLVAVLACSLAGCAAIGAWIGQLRGELFGNDYDIRQYDNYGNLVFTVHGNRVTMDCELDENGEVSSYIDITIDGESWKHVGSTLVFAQRGVDMITDFSLPADMENHTGGTGLMAVDRTINQWANYFGKELVVVVSSQNGTPIGLFQGNNCYIEIPGDLPKTTLIHIDGKLVYVHRANVDILPASLFKGN
jgi:hypothetical protein